MLPGWAWGRVLSRIGGVRAKKRLGQPAGSGCGRRPLPWGSETAPPRRPPFPLRPRLLPARPLSVRVVTGAGVPAGAPLRSVLCSPSLGASRAAPQGFLSERSKWKWAGFGGRARAGAEAATEERCFTSRSPGRRRTPHPAPPPDGPVQREEPFPQSRPFEFTALSPACLHLSSVGVA